MSFSSSFFFFFLSLLGLLAYKCMEVRVVFWWLGGLV